MLLHAKEHLFHTGNIPPASFTLWTPESEPLIGFQQTGRVRKHHLTILSLSTNSVLRFVKARNNSRGISIPNFSSLSLVHCFVTQNGLSLVSKPAKVEGQDWGDQRSVRTWLTRRQVGSCVDHQHWRRHLAHADVFTLLCSFIHLLKWFWLNSENLGLFSTEPSEPQKKAGRVVFWVSLIHVDVDVQNNYKS